MTGQDIAREIFAAWNAHDVEGFIRGDPGENSIGRSGVAPRRAGRAAVGCTA
jgi:hypothetical protein